MRVELMAEVICYQRAALDEANAYQKQRKVTGDQIVQYYGLSNLRDFYEVSTNDEARKYLYHDMGIKENESELSIDMVLSTKNGIQTLASDLYISSKAEAISLCTGATYGIRAKYKRGQIFAVRHGANIDGNLCLSDIIHSLSF